MGSRYFTVIDIWREAIILAKKKRADEADSRERAAIAQAFNDRYTYRYEYIKGMPHIPGSGVFGLPVTGGFAWMCPSCNKIHHPYEMSALVGLQYPACCGMPDGHRLYHKIKYNNEGDRT